MADPTDYSKMFSEMIGDDSLWDKLEFGQSDPQRSKEASNEPGNEAPSSNSTQAQDPNLWQQSDLFNQPAPSDAPITFSSDNGNPNIDPFLDCPRPGHQDSERTDFSFGPNWLSGGPNPTSQANDFSPFLNTVPLSGSSMAVDPFANSDPFADVFSTQSNPQPPASLYAVVVWRRNLGPATQSHHVRVHSVVDTLDVGRTIVANLKISVLTENTDWNVVDYPSGMGWYRMLDNRMIYKCWVQQVEYFGRLTAQGMQGMGGGLPLIRQEFV